MIKSHSIRDAQQLCAASRDLIDQSATLISGSGAACAIYMDQIEKTKAAVTKSRLRLSWLQLKYG